MNILIHNNGQRYITSSDSKHHFVYKDEMGGINEVNVFTDSLMIKRVADTHITKLYLGRENCVEIENDEGTIKIDLKIVDFVNNSDNIVIVYSLEDENREIRINYLGEINGK